MLAALSTITALSIDQHGREVPVTGLQNPHGNAGAGRALDLGVVRCFVEADAPRVACPRHGRHGSTSARVSWKSAALRISPLGDSSPNTYRPTRSIT